MFEALKYVDLWARGIPPVAGGALDQAAAFLDFCFLVWADEREHRAALRLPPEGALAWP